MGPTMSTEAGSVHGLGRYVWVRTWPPSPMQPPCSDLYLLVTAWVTGKEQTIRPEEHSESRMVRPPRAPVSKFCAAPELLPSSARSRWLVMSRRNCLAASIEFGDPSAIRCCLSLRMMLTIDPTTTPGRTASVASVILSQPLPPIAPL